MKTYCSIDLDYWLGPDHLYTNHERPPIDSFVSLMQKLGSVTDRRLVDQHQFLLPHIEHTDSELILHIDYHQDIAFPTAHFKTVAFNEGTFYYFLSNRETKEFVWYYPDKISLEQGLCVLKQDQPFSKKNQIFRSQTHKKGLPTDKLLKTVTSWGLAVSRDYLCKETDKNFLTDLLGPYFDQERISQILDPVPY